MTSGAWSAWRRRLAYAATLAIALTAPASHVRAATCPGNPDALGTSRTLVVDPTAHPRIGTMQYGETLPLKPGEVVLTFDDGPLPHHSNRVLDILAAECVKATFFLVGRMARQYPAGVRRVHDEGHTVATHSENHPLHFDRMAADQLQREIDDGIDAIGRALGSSARVAPFFRIPGLRRAPAVEEYLAAKGIMTWSADFPADDWRRISGEQVAALALARIAAKGKGILLLHDIQTRTVDALPVILRGLKARGYRIVHVVPASAQRPPTPTEPWQWRLRPNAAPVARARWPAPPRFVFVTEGSLPAPQALGPEASGYVREGRLLLPGRTSVRWPRTKAHPVTNALGFPVPAFELFTIKPVEADAFDSGHLRRVVSPSKAQPKFSRSAQPVTNTPLRLPSADHLPIDAADLRHAPVTAR